MTIKVLDQGLMTTVQDLGRNGFQQYGVVVGGVMDEIAARVANLLIGNEENDAVLEVTLLGPSLLFQGNMLISICGADLSAKIDGENVPLWRPIYVKEGSTLRFGRPQQGCRTYVAIAGGIDVPKIMKSRSTYVRGEIGGFEGRALQKDDVLKPYTIDRTVTRNLLNYFCRNIEKSPYQTVQWTVSSEVIPFYNKSPEIRFIKGPQYDLFTDDSLKQFLTEQYQVSPNSDRMGYRLSGEQLKLHKDVNLLSEAVTMGTIQVPNDGQPIILMADRQTVGGYPKIGYVASVDFPVLSQVMPGGKLTFKEIMIHEAQKLLLEREKTLSEFRNGIALTLRRLDNGSN